MLWPIKVAGKTMSVLDLVGYGNAVSILRREALFDNTPTQGHPYSNRYKVQFGISSRVCIYTNSCTRSSVFARHRFAEQIKNAVSDCLLSAAHTNAKTIAALYVSLNIFSKSRTLEACYTDIEYSQELRRLDRVAWLDVPSTYEIVLTKTLVTQPFNGDRYDSAIEQAWELEQSFYKARPLADLRLLPSDNARPIIR